MNLKHQIAVEIYNTLQDSVFTMSTRVGSVKLDNTDSIFKATWKNTAYSGGFALTEVGVELLIDVLKLQHWVLDVQVLNPTSGDILMLERYVNAPFYAKFNQRGKGKFTVFDQSIASQILLYGNDLKLFLKSYDYASAVPITKN